MKQLVMKLKIFVPVLLIILVANACKKSSAPANKVKSASITLKATSVKPAYKNTAAGAGISFPVKNGTLEISSAWVNFGNVNLQENTGNDGEGQYNGGSTSTSDNESSSQTADSSNIVLPGPYALNVATDTITLSQVQVFPGTFKKVDLTFMVKNDTVFKGNSIVIKGQFKATSGATFPFMLESKFAKQIELKLAKGITVSANSKVSIAIVFSLNKWLSTIDLTQAVQTNGVILIDTTHNQAILNTFESALSGANQGIELNEEHGTSVADSSSSSDSSSD